MNRKDRIKIVFILADSSLELIPQELHNDPLIRRYALSRNKRPSELILDATYHYKAINNSNLPEKNKRGRPDILHRALLTIFDSQLVFDIKPDIYVHTINGEIIWIHPDTRLPRHYNRFVGLMEKLLLERIISAKNGNILLKVTSMNLNDLIAQYSPCTVIGFSRRGRLINKFDLFIKEVIRKALNRNDKAIVNVVGCFPKGHFSKEIMKIIDDLIAISRRSLTTSYTLCKIINSYERALLN